MLVVVLHAAKDIVWLVPFLALHLKGLTVALKHFLRWHGASASVRSVSPPPSHVVTHCVNSGLHSLSSSPEEAARPTRFSLGRR